MHSYRAAGRCCCCYAVCIFLAFAAIHLSDSMPISMYQIVTDYVWFRYSLVALNSFCQTFSSRTVWAGVCVCLWLLILLNIVCVSDKCIRCFYKFSLWHFDEFDFRREWLENVTTIVCMLRCYPAKLSTCVFNTYIYIYIHIAYYDHWVVSIVSTMSMGICSVVPEHQSRPKSISP